MSPGQSSNTEQQRRRSRILVVENFKSLRGRNRVALGGLTILAGGNSSGKSSLIQPLLLIKQTLEAGYDPGPLLLDGVNYSSSSARDLIWLGPTSDTIEPSFSIGLIDRDQEETQLYFGLATHGVRLTRLRYVAPNRASSGTLRANMSPAAAKRYVVRHTPQLRSLVEGMKFEVRRNRCFYEVGLADTVPSITPFSSYFFRSFCSNLIHLPGLRDAPSRSYPATQVSTAFPGVFQSYVASVIVTWKEQKDHRLQELIRHLQELDLGWGVDANYIDDTHVELMIGRIRNARRHSSDFVNIADVGLGVSQTLPVITALLAADAGQTVFLEQPEIHLHPRAQVAIAKCIMQAVRRGVNVIAETHSNLLLRGIQEQIASGPMPIDGVQLHWFARDAEGISRIESGSIDTLGTFGRWPVDFTTEELNIERRFLRSSLQKSSEG